MRKLSRTLGRMFLCSSLLAFAGCELTGSANEQLSANRFLKSAENFERQGKYKEAEEFYRKYIDIQAKLAPAVSYDGVLGRILDLQGRHWEANQYYRKLEANHAARLNSQSTEQKPTAQKQTTELPVNASAGPAPDDHVIKGVNTAGVILADARLLRILKTIPREQALKEIDCAGLILAEENMTAADIGNRVSILDLRPIVKDYRTVDDMDTAKQRLAKMKPLPVSQQGA